MKPRGGIQGMPQLWPQCKDLVQEAKDLGSVLGNQLPPCKTLRRIVSASSEGEATSPSPIFVSM